MYQVALCEDEQVFAEAHENICRAILEKLNIQYSIALFSSSADFLRAFRCMDKQYDLILLDIIMDGINGMELAREIRKTDEDAAIIFITSTGDYMAQGYDVGALHYLEKPLDALRLERLIKRDYSKRFQRDFVVFNSRGANLKVALRDIVCMETSGRRVEVTLSDGTSVYYSGKLAGLLAEIPDRRFIRCHQAIAVNLDNIRELDHGDAIAVNGKRIPVSRAYVKIVEKAFIERFKVE